MKAGLVENRHLILSHALHSVICIISVRYIIAKLTVLARIIARSVTTAFKSTSFVRIFRTFYPGTVANSSSSRLMTPVTWFVSVGAGGCVVTYRLGVYEICNNIIVNSEWLMQLLKIADVNKQAWLCPCGCQLAILLDSNQHGPGLSASVVGASHEE